MDLPDFNDHVQIVFRFGGGESSIAGKVLNVVVDSETDERSFGDTKAYMPLLTGVKTICITVDTKDQS